MTPAISVPAASSASSVELWVAYGGVERLMLVAVLGLVTTGLVVGAVLLEKPVEPPAVSRRTVRVMVVAWVVSIVGFLVAVTVYARQLIHDHPSFTAPQSPILPVTSSAAVLTFLVLVIVRPGSDRDRVVGAGMAALAGPLVFELPFDLVVMGRTTPEVLPHPDWWRLLFFGPLVAVEVLTIALLLAVPSARITRWTLGALAALFGTFTWWATIGFGYPDHPLPHVANVVAKLCAFAVTASIVWPHGPGLMRRASCG